MKKSLRRLIFIVIDIIIIFFVFLGIYTVAEYRPSTIEVADYVNPTTEMLPDAIIQKYEQKMPMQITTWNIGYAAHGEGQNFVMDGGDMVRPESSEIIKANLDGIASFIQQNPVDFWFFQEIDEDSKRSYNINQRDFLHAETSMGSSYAYNFECFFVPFPIPPIGKVMAGVGIYSPFKLVNSERISLPVAFSWPVRTANMKRCLLISRVSLGEGNGDLVLINLHLEAFDDGEGKKAQTKMLMEVVKNEFDKGNYVIAGGDFNQTFPTENASKYPKSDSFWLPGDLSKDMLPSGEWTFVADDSVPTARSVHAAYDMSQKDTWQYYVIDGFIVSPNVTVKSIKTIDESFKYTDHNPVTIEFILD